MLHSSGWIALQNARSGAEQTAPEAKGSGPGMKVGIASDHGGFELKEELVAKLRATRDVVTDFGARLAPGDDYPDFVVPLSNAGHHSVPIR